MALFLGRGSPGVGWNFNDYLLVALDRTPRERCSPYFLELTRGSVVAAEKPLEASPEQSSNGTSSPSSGHLALRFFVSEFFGKGNKRP